MAAISTYSTVPVVIDNGSAFIKAGYADDDFPETVFETSVGSSKGAAAGGHAKAKGIIPIERGIITDWDAMEELWKQVFTDGIRVKPEEQQCMLTESPLNPKSNREKTVQIMFEAFDVPAVQLRNDASLSMYASGIMTGLVLSSGEGVTRAVPVVEGNAIPGAVKSFNLGGSQLTERLTSMLGEKGHSLTTPSERVIAQEIKEELCYVAADPDAEKGRADAGEKIEKSYELPDGSILNVGHERYMCPEALFNPVLVGMECGGVHMAVANAIGACDKGVRSKMYQNIVLSGGNTMFTGMKERLKKEVSARAPVGTKVNVVASASGTHPAWVGASIFASICKDSTQWATKEEYEEVGPEIVHKKCT